MLLKWPLFILRVFVFSILATFVLSVINSTWPHRAARILYLDPVGVRANPGFRVLMPSRTWLAAALTLLIWIFAAAFIRWLWRQRGRLERGGLWRSLRIILIKTVRAEHRQWDHGWRGDLSRRIQGVAQGPRRTPSAKV